MAGVVAKARHYSHRREGDGISSPLVYACHRRGGVVARQWGHSVDGQARYLAAEGPSEEPEDPPAPVSSPCRACIERGQAEQQPTAASGGR